MVNYASFIWSIADLLWGSFKAHQYGDVILPFTVLRRLDCVLAETKEAVLDVVAEAGKKELPVRPVLLRNRAGHRYSFFNVSPFDLPTLLGDPENAGANLTAYVNGFSPNVRDIFEKYKLEDRIEELEQANLVFLVLQRFAAVDLHPDRVSNEEMGHVFERLIRKFAEASNETAGEYFTPREVIELMVDVLFTADTTELRDGHIVRSVYDPAAGTGGMLSVADDHVRTMNRSAQLSLAGQEINPQSYTPMRNNFTSALPTQPDTQPKRSPRSVSLSAAPAGPPACATTRSAWQASHTTTTHSPHQHPHHIHRPTKRGHQNPKPAEQLRQVSQDLVFGIK